MASIRLRNSEVNIDTWAVMSGAAPQPVGSELHQLLEP